MHVRACEGRVMIKHWEIPMLSVLIVQAHYNSINIFVNTQKVSGEVRGRQHEDTNPPIENLIFDLILTNL